jgi:uncharacterized protein
MKYLLLLVVVAVAVWMLTARNRSSGRSDEATPPGRKKSAAAESKPTPMLACAHCGLHLPQSDALFDAGGKPFCSEAHRLAGPR